MARLNEVEYRAAQTALASGQITDPARAARFKSAVAEYESEQAAKGATDSSGAQVPYWEDRAAPATPDRLMQFPTPEAARSIPADDYSEDAIMEMMRRNSARGGQQEIAKLPGKPQVSTRPVDAFTDYTKPPLVYHDKPELKPEENDARYNELVQAGVREGSRVMRERDLAPSEKLAMDSAENVMAGVVGADLSLTGGLGMQLGARALEDIFVDGMGGGLLPSGYREEMLEGAVDRSPIPATVGAVAGAVGGGPKSVAGMSDRIGMGIASKLVPGAAKSVGGRIAQAGARGAIGGAAGSVAQGAVEDAVELGGRAIDGRLPTLDQFVSEELDRMGARMGYGAAIGGAAGTASGVGGEMHRALREEPGVGADLKRNESRPGGGTSIWSGVKQPDDVKPLIRKAGEEGGYPEVLARDKAFPLLSERIDDEIDTTRKLTQKESAEFNEGPSGGEKAPLRKSSEEAMSIIRSLRASDGKLLPLADGGPSKEFLKRTLDAEVVPVDDPRLQEIDPDLTIPMESAQALGLDVKAPPKTESSILDPYGRPFGADDEATEYTVVLTPRQLTGQEMQDTITYLSSGIKDSAKGKRSTDDEAIFKRLRAAVLEDRNQIANGTFSDLKQSQHLRLKKLEQQLQAAGLDAKANEVDIKVLKTEEGLKNAIMGFGEKGNEPRDRLLLEVAKNNQDLKDALEVVAATKATQRLRGKAGGKAVLHEGGITGYGAGAALKLHSDPIFTWFNRTPALRRGTVGGAALEDED